MIWFDHGCCKPAENSVRPSVWDFEDIMVAAEGDTPIGGEFGPKVSSEVMSSFKDGIDYLEQQSDLTSKPDAPGNPSPRAVLAMKNGQLFHPKSRPGQVQPLWCQQALHRATHGACSMAVYCSVCKVGEIPPQAPALRCATCKYIVCQSCELWHLMLAASTLATVCQRQQLTDESSSLSEQAVLQSLSGIAPPPESSKDKQASKDKEGSGEDEYVTPNPKISRESVESFEMKVVEGARGSWNARVAAETLQQRECTGPAIFHLEDEPDVEVVCCAFNAATVATPEKDQPTPSTSCSPVPCLDLTKVL